MNSGKHPVLAALRAAFPVSMPVLAGYLFLGMGYGVLMSRLGYGPFWTGFLSVIILGGTIQYVATTLLAADFDPANAFIISVMLNARHLFYGFSMLGRYAGTGWKKPLLVFWLTDETFSLVCGDETPEGIDPIWYRFWISGLDYGYWIAGSLIGNLAGHGLRFNSQGIDFVMTALFTVIVINQWRGARSHWPAGIGLAASVLCLTVLGPDHFLIPAMALIVVFLLGLRARLEPALRGETEGCP